MFNNQIRVRSFGSIIRIRLQKVYTVLVLKTFRLYQICVKERHKEIYYLKDVQE